MMAWLVTQERPVEQLPKKISHFVAVVLDLGLVLFLGLVNDRFLQSVVLLLQQSHSQAQLPYDPPLLLIFLLQLLPFGPYSPPSESLSPPSISSVPHLPLYGPDWELQIPQCGPLFLDQKLQISRRGPLSLDPEMELELELFPLPGPWFFRPRQGPQPLTQYSHRSRRPRKSCHS